MRAQGWPLSAYLFRSVCWSGSVGPSVAADANSPAAKAARSELFSPCHPRLSSARWVRGPVAVMLDLVNPAVPCRGSATRVGISGLMKPRGATRDIIRWQCSGAASSRKDARLSSYFCASAAISEATWASQIHARAPATSPAAADPTAGLEKQGFSV
jgi:hypothetical protein